MRVLAISIAVVLTALLQVTIVEGCSCMPSWYSCPNYLSYITVNDEQYVSPDIEGLDDMDPWYREQLGHYIYTVTVHSTYNSDGELSVPFVTKTYQTAASGSMCGSSLLVGSDYIISDWDIATNDSGFGLCSVVIPVVSELEAVAMSSEVYSTCGDQVSWEYMKRMIPDKARGVANIPDKARGAAVIPDKRNMQNARDLLKKWLGQK